MCLWQSFVRWIGAASRNGAALVTAYFAGLKSPNGILLVKIARELQRLMFKPKPWLAAILSVLDMPLGLLYAGSMRHALTYWLLLWSFYLLSAIAIAMGNMHAAVVLLLLATMVLIRAVALVAAWRLAARQTPTAKRWYQRRPALLLCFCVSLCIAFGIQLFNKTAILEALYVPGRSMAATINHADRIFVDKLFYRARELERGEVIVYRLDDNLYVSRIAAVGGDTIELKGQTLLVNSKQVDEAYVSYRPAPFDLPDLPETYVPVGHVFVLGDNRNFSSDSRSYGPIPVQDCYGRPVNIYFSRNYESVDHPKEGPTHTAGSIAWERLGKNIQHPR